MAYGLTLEEVEQMAQRLPAAQQLKLVAHIGERLSAALPQQAPEAADPLADLKFADTKTLRPVIDAAFTAMGIDITQPAPSAIAVQQLMLREGIKPEDNIFSGGIIEARKE